MIIKLSKKRVKGLLEKYYKEEFDCDGKVTMNISKGYVDYYEHLGCVVDTKFIGKMNVLGDVTNFKVDLSIQDIENVLKIVFEREGYEVSNVSCNYGLDSRLEGYGMGEYVESYPYFRGVEVRIKDKIKKIGGIKNEKY